ncbi:MAG: hypothetical protein ACUVUC_12765 [Thermoguttaceae bacterium]
MKRATLTAAALVALRRYRFAHIGAWWACAVYTVLTLRWAAISSLFLT